LIDLALDDALEALAIPVNLELIATIGIQDGGNLSAIAENDWAGVVVGNCCGSADDIVNCGRDAGAIDQLVGVLADVAGFTITRAVGTVGNSDGAEGAAALVEEVSVRTGVTGHVGEAHRATC
jgi:hypothetical protein